MMNQNQPKEKNKVNDEYSYRDNISNFVKGLGAYIAVVSSNIFWLILFTIIFEYNLTRMVGLLAYLFSSISLLVLYSIITSKTVSKDVSYKILQVIKRFFDVLISASCLFLILPVLVLIFIVIKLDSPGPVFFRLMRVGQFGKRIDVYKIRTMHYEPKENPITRVGQFLRRYNLNELPMLINVLTGELSFVGPLLRSYENLTESLDKDKKILEVRPGLIGLAQLSSVSLQQTVKLDLEYIENWSLLLDFKIIFKTFSVILFNKT